MNTAELSTEGLNILMSHQYYDGGSLCESEVSSIGNLDNVGTEVLEPFDYCALGHLHNPQHINKETCRYSGTLLKYSASEVSVQKTITLLETNPDRTIQIQEIPIIPKREMIHIKGTFERLLSNEFLRSVDKNAYVFITLEDHQEIFQAYEKLHENYPYILKIDYCNLPKVNALGEYAPTPSKMKHPMEIAAEFYAKQNQDDLDEEMQALLRKVWEEIHETN